MAFCSKCGNEVNDDFLFCPKCGKSTGKDAGSVSVEDLQKSIQKLEARVSDVEQKLSDKDFGDLGNGPSLWQH